MSGPIHPFLTVADHIVLRNLFRDLKRSKAETAGLDIKTKTTQNNEDKKAAVVTEIELNSDSSDSETETKVHRNNETDIARLLASNEAKNAAFQTTVFTGFDPKDIPDWFNNLVINPYTKVAQKIVRHPTDVVFLTHILLYFVTSLPSAAWLFFGHFTWLHGIAHIVWSLYCCGPFTLMLHNHIHNSGVLAKQAPWKWFDWGFPYLLEPLMGHTWDSYFYHHVKHHHVESNGPDDLSSTIRYQRDSLPHFLHYWARFFFFCWIELPLYFLRKRKPGLALRALTTELATYAFYALGTWYNWRAATCVLLVPFVQMRIGLMIGNWGQHALVDEVEPDSDFRSSITLIDVPSNRFCFNDGYHTAHHLNPRRHWRDQPVHFLQSKQAYLEGRALVFHNIDYLMMTVSLLRKDYMKLASCLVPIGDQIGMTQVEIADMLRTKTRKFSEEEIQMKFKTSPTAGVAK